MAYAIFHCDAWGAVSQGDASHSRYKRKTRIKSRVPNATVNAPGEAGMCGHLREVISEAAMALPLVRTVTVKAAGAPTLRSTEAGAWHVAPKGAPVQVREMVPL